MQFRCLCFRLSAMERKQECDMPVLMRLIAAECKTPSVRVSTGMSSVSDSAETLHPLGIPDSIANL